MKELIYSSYQANTWLRQSLSRAWTELTQSLVYNLNRAMPTAYTGRSQSPRKTELERNLEQYLEHILNRAYTALVQNEYMAYTNLIPSSDQASTEVRTARKQSYIKRL